MKKIFIIILGCLAVIVYLIITSTYSKYSSTGQVSVSGDAGAWVIKINNEDVTRTGGTTATFNINGINYSTSSHVANGKIAPGSSESFQINIDATGTVVAVRFDVIIDKEEVTLPSQMRMGSIKKMVNDVEEVNGIIQTDENIYTGIITLDDIKEEKTITIDFIMEWVNDITGAHDAEDSQIGLNSGIETLNIPLTVNLTQYNGETIEAYVGD